MKVLLVDDDADLLAALTQTLELAGFEVLTCASAVEALRRVTNAFDGVVLSDVRMPQMDGLALFRRFQTMDADLPVILLTGHGDVPMAVQAIKDGAYDFLTKPVSSDVLVPALRRAATARRLVMENRALRQAAAPRNVWPVALIGDSPAMTRLRDTIAQVADADVDVLIEGPGGSGKAQAARMLHRLSGRRSRAFVHVACASLKEDGFDLELFGTASGTGYAAASRRTPGRLEKAHRGVLFLDDVDHLTPAQQAAIFRALDAHEIWPSGADSPVPVDLRVIAASGGDLSLAVREGRFRSDLFYRLSGVSLSVPPLSARGQDIGLLFQHMLMAASARLKRPAPPITEAARARLYSHDWPGNLRELEHFAERFALGLTTDAECAEEDGLAERVARFEAEVLRETLARCEGKAQAAMQRLNLARKTFYDKLNRYGIVIGDYRRGG
jgi:two-component system C4-dicarboxylate transport response regulator DctD